MARPVNLDKAVETLRQISEDLMVTNGCTVANPGAGSDDGMGNQTAGSAGTYTVDCSIKEGVPGSRSGGDERLNAGVMENAIPWTVKMPWADGSGNPYVIKPDAVITYSPSGKRLQVRSVIQGKTRQVTTKAICVEIKS